MLAVVLNNVVSVNEIPVAGTAVHRPVSPAWGAFPARFTTVVPVFRHWSLPASAKVGPGVPLVVTVTVSEPGAGHVLSLGFSMVHLNMYVSLALSNPDINVFGSLASANEILDPTGAVSTVQVPTKLFVGTSPAI